MLSLRLHEQAMKSNDSVASKAFSNVDFLISKSCFSQRRSVGAISTVLCSVDESPLVQAKLLL